jgi:hypothetical protein
VKSGLDWQPNTDGIAEVLMSSRKLGWQPNIDEIGGVDEFWNAGFGNQISMELEVLMSSKMHIVALPVMLDQ